VKNKEEEKNRKKIAKLTLPGKIQGLVVLAWLLLLGVVGM